MKSLLCWILPALPIVGLIACLYPGEVTVWAEPDPEVEICSGPLVKVFDNTNTEAVGNNGQSPTFNVPDGNKDQTCCLVKVYCRSRKFRSD